MNIKQDLERVVEQLRSLKTHCESMKESGEEWEKDAQALDYAIEKLTRTAQEVPVQEQCDNYGEKMLLATVRIIELPTIIQIDCP